MCVFEMIYFHWKSFLSPFYPKLSIQSSCRNIEICNAWTAELNPNGISNLQMHWRHTLECPVIMLLKGYNISICERVNYTKRKQIVVKFQWFSYFLEQNIWYQIEVSLLKLFLLLLEFRLEIVNSKSVRLKWSFFN